MNIITIASILITFCALFSYINYRFIKLPTTIGIMVIALVVSSFIMVMPAFGLNIMPSVQNIMEGIDFSETLLHGMLSFLLFAGALHVNWQSLKEQKYIISFMAVVGTVSSTALVGVVVYHLFPVLGFDISFIHALLFGALISPTDPIAVMAILKKAGVPKTLETKVVGESLFNDGVAVVIFLALMGIATHGEVSASHIAMLFVEEAIGGAFLGLVMGYIAFLMLRSVDNYQVEILLTLALVMGGGAVLLFYVMKLRFIILIMLVGLFLPQISYAQTLPGGDVGRIEERLPETLRGGGGNPSTEIPLIEGIPFTEQEVKDGDPGATFKVDAINFLGNTVFVDEELQRYVEGAVGEDITLTKLKQAALNVTRYYREAGYPFALAFLPKQTLENHTVVLEVIEGYVADVEFRGMSVSAPSKINAYAEKLKTKRPVSQRDLEHYALLINDLAGVQARVIMSLIKDQPGALRMILLLEESDHEVGLSFNSRGSESVGPFQISSFYKRNDLFGINEQTTLSYLTIPGNDELHYWSIAQVIPVGSEGAKFSTSFRTSKSIPGDVAKAFEVEGYSNAINMTLSYPWIRSFNKNFTTSLAFDSRNSSTQSFGTEIIDDHLRILRANMFFNALHHRGNTKIEGGISQGLNILNVTKPGHLKASRAAGENDATKINASISRHQMLTDHFSLKTNLTGQWAWKPLLSAELFGLGGSEYGRAFDFSTLTGDHGYGASIELNYKVDHQFKNVNKLDVFTFVDGGQVYDETRLIGKNWQGLSSMGFGLNIGMYNGFDMKFEVAKPIKMDWGLTDDYNTKAFLSLGYKTKF